MRAQLQGPRDFDLDAELDRIEHEAELNRRISRCNSSAARSRRKAKVLFDVIPSIDPDTESDFFVMGTYPDLMGCSVGEADQGGAMANRIRKAIGGLK